MSPGHNAAAQAVEAFRAALPDPTIVDGSRLTRAMYATDASLYRVVPEVVAKPRNRAELIATVRAALAAGLPVTARGAGTSCAGNAVGPGVVIDLGRHLNRVLAVDALAGTAVVDPGVVQAALQQRVTAQGWRYGPDPSTSNRCTVGGMIGNNACGPRALGYGRSADNIVELEVVTGTGELVTLKAGASGGILDRLRALVLANLTTIRTEFGRFSRQVSGYSLEHLLPERGFDAAAFFAGTEGTLGIITRATVRLARDAACKTTVALGYPAMADGADDMPALLAFEPTACEGMDRRLVDVVANRLGPDAVPGLPAGDGWLFIELVGEDATEVRHRAEAMVQAAQATEGWVIDDPGQAARMWAIRTDAAGLAAVALPRPAHAGWEDAAVPPQRLGAYLREFDRLLTRFGLHGLPYGHFGEGCVHCRIDFPLADADGTKVLHEFMFAAGELVARHGGSMSGEHGDGRARSELLPLMYSPTALELFERVKALFDPRNLLNPGVLVAPDPLAGQVRIAQLRASPLARADWEFTRKVHQCTGVGKCRADTTRSGAVMCPSFQASGEERDATRGRARVLQEMLNGSLITEGWRSPEVARALELCLACKGCRRDCPTGIDMAAYKSRVLYESYRGRPRPISHYALGWLPSWGRLTTRLRLGWLANLFLQTPGFKHLVRALAGVDQRRPMPRFRTGAAARREQQTGAPQALGARGPIAIWVDSFTDAFAGQQLAALVNLLVRIGFIPKVIGQDACCGLTWITTGQLIGARRRLRHALDVLYPLVSEQIPVIGMEPSCLAVWRSDAAELLDDDRVPLVAGGIKTLAELLSGLADWEPPDLTGHTIVAQPHCHHSSVLGWSTDARLLARTGASVISLGGCCGLAGNFGVERGHYETSVKVAEHDLLPALRAAGPEAIILADGFSCRKQVADLTGGQAITLAQLLAAHSEP